MPKDDWAKARARDTARRAKSSGSFYKSRGPKKKASRKKRREKVRNQSRASRRQHEKKLGQAAKMLEVPVGSSVQIRKARGGEWMPYVTQKTVRAPVSFEGDAFIVVRFERWLIKIPRPTGF